MNRVLWFVAGGACGVYTLVKARRTVHAFTPDGIGARVAAWGAGAKVFADEVARGMTEREISLRAQVDLPAADLLMLEERPDSVEPASADGRPWSEVAAEVGFDGHR